jgi:uncharacterized membrane protein HdeD (DUF308 family)
LYGKKDKARKPLILIEERTAMTEGIVTSWVKDAKKNAGWLITLGVLGIVVGFMAIVSPLVAGKSVAIMVGVFMLVAGLSQLVGSFKAGSFGSGSMGFFSGLLTSLAGLLMFFQPLIGLGILAIILGIYFFTDGISEIVLAFRVRPEEGWVWILISGVLAILLGFFIFRQWPISGAWAVGILVGIHLLFRGVSLVAIGVAARGGLSRVQAELKQRGTAS